MVIQSNNPQIPSKNKKKLENTLESLKQLPQGHKKKCNLTIWEKEKLFWETRGEQDVHSTH